ncbi:MAG: barstar family protein [Lachnospiraceae bacterium]|nr:barstar family protein [Lachnospiraceae bacterium]
MKKVLLDFQVPATPEQVQDYLALKFDFPEYYGANLDAFYDMLTDIGEDTCVGVFETQEDLPVCTYVRKVKRVLGDAEQENPHLCVIFANLEDNYDEEKGWTL